METLESGICQEELGGDVQKWLILPERVGLENQQVNLGQNLGVFVVQKGYITQLQEKEDNEDTRFDYDNESKSILIPKDKVSLNYWRDNFFRMQTLLSDEKKHPLFPMHPLYSENRDQDEISTYMFLNTTVKAYQEYLKDKESVRNDINPNEYYEKIIKGEVKETPTFNLYRICYEKREIDTQRGLSIPGSSEECVSEEIEDRKKEIEIRALEDFSHLVTMYLWNPKYCQGFIDYLPEREKANLGAKVFKISTEEAEVLKNLLFDYTEQMKEEINYKKENI